MKKIKNKNIKQNFLSKIIKNILKPITEPIKTTYRLVIGFSYIIYTIIKTIDDFFIKIFYTLNRPMRVILIYTFIGITIFTIYNPDEITIYKNKIVEMTIKLDENIFEEQKEDIIKAITICKMKDIECKIYNKALEKGLTVEQAYILLAISKHETRNWTSKAFYEKNNLGGIMCNSGLRTYSSLDEGIEAFVTLLKNRYFDKGLDTIDKIQPVYCPIGAKNDPYNQNQYWLPNVTKYYNEYLD